MFKKLSILFFVSLFGLACSTDDGETETNNPVLEKPMKAVIAELTVVDTQVNTGLLMEFGYEFRPLKNGTISAIIVNMPQTGDYRVTLWDADREEIMVSTVIRASAETNQNSFNMNIPIQTDKKYVVTVQADDWVRYEKSDGSDFLPFRNKNIEILSYAENVTNTTAFPDRQLYPDFFHTSFMQGYVDIEFKPEN